MDNYLPGYLPGNRSFSIFGRKVLRMNKSSSTPSSFFILVIVFFFWGFLAASNGIFIPFCKTHFNLSQFQSQLIDSAFYGAYFIGSLVLYMTSLQINRDILNGIGYKKAIVYGLLISIAGALTMIPAVNSGSFIFILFAFFIIALGFSLQQTAANPLALNLGNPATGSNRLSFAGSVNSLGTTVGPILVSVILLGKITAGDADKAGASLSSITVLYIVLAVTFGVAALIFALSKIGKLSIEENASGELKILKEPLRFILGTLLLLIVVFAILTIARIDSSRQFIFLSALTIGLVLITALLFMQYKKIGAAQRFEAASYPQVTLGMLAIFIYVGVEVTIQSNLGTLLKQPEFGGLADHQIGPYISLYWGSLMIGRWTGSIGAFRMNHITKIILTLLVPVLAFSLVLYMNFNTLVDAEKFYPYLGCVAILIAGFFYSNQKPAKTLLLFGLLGTLAMLIGLFTTGATSIYAFLSGGLFCSIMWPCIFSLAIAGLGKFTSQASAFLIMMILGGAFIPPLQGLIADKANIHISYVIPVCCFAYLAWYAWKTKKTLSSQGIDYDATTGSGH